jgi:hypothetical protein
MNEPALPAMMNGVAVIMAWILVPGMALFFLAFCLGLVGSGTPKASKLSETEYRSGTSAGSGIAPFVVGYAIGSSESRRSSGSYSSDCSSSYTGTTSSCDSSSSSSSSDGGGSCGGGE